MIKPYPAPEPTVMRKILDGNRPADYVTYWHRMPGRYVLKETGEDCGDEETRPLFYGTVTEWYSLLGEAVYDAWSKITDKGLTGMTSGIIVSKDIQTVLETTHWYRGIYHYCSCCTAKTEWPVIGVIDGIPVYASDEVGKKVVVFMTGCEKCDLEAIAEVRIKGMSRIS